MGKMLGQQGQQHFCITHHVQNTEKNVILVALLGHATYNIAW